MNYKKIYLKLIVLLLILFLTCSIPATSQYCSFEGTTENFNLTADEGVVELNATSFYLAMNKTVYQKINYIIITKRNGEVYNANVTNLQVYYIDKYRWKFPGAQLNAEFRNVTFEKPNENNFILIRGDLDESRNVMTSIKENVIISSVTTRSVLVSGKELSDFQTIELVVDDESYVELHSTQVRISATQLSDFLIYSTSLEKATINSNGILRLDDHKYSVESIDKIEISKSPSSLFRVTDEKIRFNGEIESASLNDKDIMTNDLSYWFDQKTDKINALSSFIIAIITAVLGFITYKQVKYSSKVTEQNEKNSEFTLNAQKREHIQNQLALFYYPIHDYLRSSTTVNDDENTDGTSSKRMQTKIRVRNNDHKNDTQYNKIVAHQYLARANTKLLFNQFITFLYESASSTDSEFISVFENLKAAIKQDINELNDELNGLMN